MLQEGKKNKTNAKKNQKCQIVQKRVKWANKCEKGQQMPEGTKKEKEEKLHKKKCKKCQQ